MDNQLSIREEFQIANVEKVIHFNRDIDRVIFEFRKLFPDQHELSKVPDRPDMSRELKDICAEFGIIVGNRTVIDSSNIKYLLIVDPSWEDNLEEMCEDFVAQNIPAPNSPTYYIIDKELNSLEEVSKWQSRLWEIYPDIQSLASYSRLVKAEGHLSRAKAKSDEAEALGYYPVFISDLLDPMIKEFETRNVETLAEFQKLEAAILEEKRKHPNLILMSGFTNLRYVPKITAYMYYKHDIPCHLDSRVTVDHLSNVSRLQFSTYHMLVEEQIEYLRNLPRVAITFDSMLHYGFFVFLEKSRMECKFRLSYIDVESIKLSDVVKTEIHLDDLSVIPWDFEYDLKTKDLRSFREAHDKVLGLFRKFEKKLPARAKLLTMNNTFLLEIDGKKKLALVEGIDLRLPAVLTPLSEEMERSDTVLNLDFLPKLYPMSVLPDFKKELGPHMMQLISVLKKTESNIDMKNIGAFPKVGRPLGFIIKEFNNYQYLKLGVSKVTDYMTLGLWWREIEMYNRVLTEKLFPHLDAKASRNYGAFFSIFGGPFPLFPDILLLREEFLKE